MNAFGQNTTDGTNAPIVVVKDAADDITPVLVTLLMKDGTERRIVSLHASGDINQVRFVTEDGVVIVPKAEVAEVDMRICKGQIASS